MKKLSVLLLLALSLTTVTSCGKEKDTGVIINAGDNSSGDSKDSNLISSDEVKTEKDTTSSSTTTTGGKAVKREVELKVKVALRSSWVADDDSVYEFKKDGTIAGIDSKTGANLTGTWESDYKTYVKLNLTNRYEVKDGKIVNLKDKTIKWKIVDHNFYYRKPPMTMTVNDGEKDIKLKWRNFMKAENDKEEDYVTYTVGPENPEDYTEEELRELEEQYEEARKDKSDDATNPYTGMTRAEAKEKGLDWDTGTPLVNQEE